MTIQAEQQKMIDAARAMATTLMDLNLKHI